MHRAKLSDLGDGGGNHRDPGTAYKKGRPGSQAGGVQNGSVLEGHGGEARGPDGRDQGRPVAEKTVGGTPGNGLATKGRHRMSLVPPKKTLREAQVRVVVPTPRARGTVMIEMGPGPFELCPV